MNLQLRREIRACFSISIVLNNPEIELIKAIETSITIDKATKAMISGKISPEELLEFIEPHMEGIVPFDDYIEEVEQNCSLILG